MKFVLLSSLSAVLATTGAASTTTLRGNVASSSIESVNDDEHHFRRINPPDSSCFKKANTVDVCEGIPSVDGFGNCVWCQTTPEAGICVSRENAKDITQVMGIPCPKLGFKLLATARAQQKLVTKKIDTNEDMQHVMDVITNGAIPDVNCFKSAWSAENAETTCKSTKDTSGKDCIWCQTTGDVAGVCLSAQESGMANGQFGLTCPNNNAEEMRTLVTFDKFMEMQH